MRGGWGRKGGGQGQGTAGGARLTGLLFARSIFPEAECDEFRFGFLGVVLDDVAGLECLATVPEGMNPEADGTVRRTLGKLRHDKVVVRNAGRIRV